MEISTRAERMDQGGRRRSTWLVTRDVSMHGAFLETKRPFPLETPVRLMMDLGKHLVEAVGRVVRVAESGMGIDFTQVEVVPASR